MYQSQCKSDRSCFYTTSFSTLHGVSGTEPEKLKVKFQKLFKEKELGITIQYNLKIFNYLDITLNFNNSAY